MENPEKVAPGPNPFYLPSWSATEKKIARRVFDMAFQKELAPIIRKVQQIALSIQDASGLWKLEDYIAGSRKLIASRYDYRYSQLPIVFGHLVQDGLITLEDLQGLAENKLGYVRLVMENGNRVRRGKRDSDAPPQSAGSGAGPQNRGPAAST